MTNTTPNLSILPLGPATNVLTNEQAKRLQPRIVIKGVWGKPSSLATSANYNAEQLLRAAQMVPGGVRGVSLSNSLSGAQCESNKPDPRAGIQPTYALLRDVATDNAANSLTAWNPVQLPNPSFYIQAFNPFRNSRQGPYYTNGGADGVARWIGPTVPYMRAHWIRFLIPPQNENQKRQAVRYLWGSANLRWMCEVDGSDVLLYRLATTYNETDQTTLDSLLNSQNTTTAQQGQINDLRASLYASTNKIGTVTPGADAARALELTFIPEPIGRVGVVLNQQYQVIEVPEVIGSGTVGTIWDNGPTEVRTTGGAMAWQWGLVTWNTVASIAAPSNLAQSAQVTGKADTSLPGTGVAYQLDNSDTVTDPATQQQVQRYAPKITLTSDGQHPARLYYVRGWSSGGERVVPDDSVVLDTGTSTSPIRDVPYITDYSIECQGQYSPLDIAVSIADPNEKILAPGFSKPYYHDRMCDIYLNGQKIAGNQLIVASTVYGIAKANQNQAQIQGRDFSLVLETTDMWHLLEEWTIRENVVLDGMKVNDALRLLIALPGTRASEMAGIPANQGAVMDSSTIGQDALYHCGLDETVAERVRKIMSEYYPDKILTPRTGVWTLQDRDTSIKVKFMDNPNLAATNPPEARILAPLALVRDFRNTPNNFQRLGGDDAFGNPITQVFERKEATSNSNNLYYVGRTIRARSIVDKSYTTPTSVQRGVRADAFDNRLSGRANSFNTIFIGGLYPGARCVCGAQENATVCEITSMSETDIGKPGGEISWTVTEIN